MDFVTIESRPHSDAISTAASKELEQQTSPPPELAGATVIGKTGSYLSQRGFGWMLEVEEAGEEEDQRPLLNVLEIDLQDIIHKLRCAIVPLPSSFEVLKESEDFWGPLFVVLGYAFLLLWGQLCVVSWVITVWCGGATLIYFLERTFGEDISFTQVLGSIGYCLLPLVPTVFLHPLVMGISPIPWLGAVFKLAGVGWSTYSATCLLVSQEMIHRRILLVYPLLLLYLFFISLHAGV